MGKKKDKNAWAKTKLKAMWIEWRGFLLIVMVMFSFRSALADWNDVPSGSMKPTILQGDRVFVNKLAYDLKIPFTLKRIAKWADPDVGDIVVFFGKKDGTRLVKRVIGKPGDTIEIRDHKLYLNGEAVDYTKVDGAQFGDLSLDFPVDHAFYNERLGDVDHIMMHQVGSNFGGNMKKTTVPEDSYFVMGDHRDNSYDSRFWGFIGRERIVGKANTVVFSLNPDNYYIPRNRWLVSL